MRRFPGSGRAALAMAAAALLAVSTSVPSLAAWARPQAPELVPTVPVPGTHPATLASSPGAPMLPPGHPLAGQPSTSGLYDEQLGITFTQGFLSMLYNVTAVPQTDQVSGTGPAYLLNGVTTSGYWYQVGVSWDWSPGQGFSMNYEVFGPSGASVYPSAAGSGLVQFKGQVSPGDTIALNLYFRSGQVVMLAVDRNSSAYATESYSAEGATSFVGSPLSTANGNGFFTGLMTEWYHGDAYFGNQQATAYTTSLAQRSAWMWMDEFSCSNSNCTKRTPVFSVATNGPVTYVNPTQLITFSSHGATELSSAYSFITGTLNQSTVALTVSYSVVGGGSYSPPAFSYLQDGSLRTANLTAAGSTYLVDSGSTWNVTRTLAGAGAGERWAAANATRGVAAVSQSLRFVFYLQYFVVFQATVEGGGSGYSLPTVRFTEFGLANSTGAGTGAWADAGTAGSFPPTLAGSTAAERWATNDTSLPIGGPGVVSAVYVHQYAVSTAALPGGGGTVSPPPGWFDAGGVLSLRATASQGWEFEGWSGSGPGAYSGDATSATLEVSGPLNESALFYPGLTVAVAAGGTVAFAYAGGSGTAASGSTTVYAPLGTTVTLSARASSPLYVFSGWGGAKGDAVETVRLSGPEAAEASFGYNLPVLLALGVVAALVLAAAFAFALRRRPNAGRWSTAAPLM